MLSYRRLENDRRQSGELIVRMEYLLTLNGGVDCYGIDGWSWYLEINTVGVDDSTKGIHLRMS